eukprot:3104002-Prymnesium_polylepis.2
MQIEKCSKFERMKPTRCAARLGRRRHTPMLVSPMMVSSGAADSAIATNEGALSDSGTRATRCEATNMVPQETLGSRNEVLSFQKPAPK